MVTYLHRCDASTRRTPLGPRSSCRTSPLPSPHRKLWQRHRCPSARAGLCLAAGWTGRAERRSSGLSPLTIGHHSQPSSPRRRNGTSAPHFLFIQPIPHFFDTRNANCDNYTPYTGRQAWRSGETAAGQTKIRRSGLGFMGHVLRLARDGCVHHESCREGQDRTGLGRAGGRETRVKEFLFAGWHGTGQGRETAC